MAENQRAQLFTKILKVMEAVERVPKRGRNDHHGYDYVTEADVSETIRKALIKEGLVFLPSATEQSMDGKITSLGMEMLIADTETGESIKLPWQSQGHDSTDKGIFKAMTGGVKYFWMKATLVPTGDDPEREDAPQKQTRPDDDFDADVAIQNAKEIIFPDDHKYAGKSLYDVFQDDQQTVQKIARGAKDKGVKQAAKDLLRLGGAA